MKKRTLCSHHNYPSSDHHHHRQVVLIALCPLPLSLSLSLSRYPSHRPSFLSGALDCIRCPHRADVCKSLPVSKLWCAIEECHLWVHPKFSSNTQHVLGILVVWFVRWEVSSRAVGVLWGAASRVLFKTARSLFV